MSKNSLVTELKEAYNKSREIFTNARNKNKVKESYLSNALDSMLQGLPIKNSETKALGCSIKFK